MKRWKKILLIVLAVILVILAGLCIWQRENIYVVYLTLTNSSEELAQKMNERKNQFIEEAQKQYPTIVDDFTAEEEKKIIKGELSVEEAMEELRKKYEEKKEAVVSGGNADAENSNNNGSIVSSNSEEVDNLIGDKVIELYSLKAYYLGQLGQIEANVKRDYARMPKEKRNLVGKKELVDKYMGTALGHMEACDEKVAQLLGELESGLKALNADTSIIKTIKKAYDDEKTLKKAYYLSLMDE